MDPRAEAVLKALNSFSDEEIAQIVSIALGTDPDEKKLNVPAPVQPPAAPLTPAAVQARRIKLPSACLRDGSSS